MVKTTTMVEGVTEDYPPSNMWFFPNVPKIAISKGIVNTIEVSIVGNNKIIHW